MKRFAEIIKLPSAVILSALLIIGFSAIVSTLYQGRYSTITAMNESISEISSAKFVSVSEALKEAEDVFIPEKILHQQASELRTVKCKKYTEFIVYAENCTVTVRKYNYAYLTEDDSVAFPEDTEKINVNGHDIFVFVQNGKSTALYYSGLSRCIIEAQADIMNIFQ